MDRAATGRLAVLAAATGLALYGADARFDRKYGIEAGTAPLHVPQAMTRVGEIYDDAGSIPFTLGVTGGVALVGAATGRRHLVRTAGIALESVAFTKLFTQVLKRSIGRSRPLNDEGPRNFRALNPDVPGNHQSMPSGHTSSAFALVSVFAARYPSPWLAVPLYGFAASVAMQRVDSRSHYLSDVMVGGVLGTLVGRSLVRWHTGKGESRVFLAPSVAPGHFGSTLVLRL